MLDGATAMANQPDLSLEIIAGGIVAGVDEAGRGPWAGPVVAGAVILDQKNIPNGINDSKKISAIKRKKLYEEILQSARTGVGISTVEEIDEYNILEATKLAMQRAVSMLGSDMTLVLIDGNKAPALPFPTKIVIGGDAKSLSIAAASIIAKVTRDRIMHELGEANPEYGWEKNSGYGTKHHINALAKYGITEHHRKSYKPIRELLERSVYNEYI
jgi:ribonuclease HII